ncbi:ferredoxin--NADP reductase [Parashewanella tropica]|uniref:ferredoxin--NADP reductase n=1 Tax=Parashewanella tropica TaxID=2547970 RepID=UPI00105A849B|nr:ferredoxin--NADP reductase [Parashewanella tropica]
MWITGKVVERIDWNDKLFTLKIDADLAPFTAGQFIKLSETREGKRVARAYSLVNPPNSRYLEVLAVEVEDGQLSPVLQNLNVDDTIEVSATAAGFMVLDEIPTGELQGKHLWFLATGTAVGPFISMMETDEPWQRFEKVVLVYGVRTVEDLAYLVELRSLEEKYPEQFTLVLSVTRESFPQAISTRIPQAIASGELEQITGIEFSSQDSQVMICGNPGMVQDAQQFLFDKGLKKNLRRAPGNITVEKYW